ncbi:hypothetical protein BJ508DRAFT_333560 [Ascobolus immersus RN42]|uniref:F-box domain-containing protein n=1 Tax=Ascobolus immersus RN42 TaxID=1160509 RepID=A0A3N4HPL8_ASCIM|nr:hypothetical protein BJ508DRAFT_333560 [Ascobolus immersus RN42]
MAAADKATPFFTLPLEMRIEIFSHCSLLNLLILTHTCRTFYTDINCTRRLVKRFSGYPRETQTVPDPNTKRLTMLPNGLVPLTIRIIAMNDNLVGTSIYDYDLHDFVNSPENENNLFNRVYGPHERRPIEHSQQGWWCCNGCFLVKGFDEYGRDLDPDVPPFFTLPLELRLEVYSHCSILSLLILTHTCLTIYTDINSTRRLVQRSKGYPKDPESWSSAEARLAGCQLLPPGFIPLTIPMMADSDTLCLRSISSIASTVAPGRSQSGGVAAVVKQSVKERLWKPGTGCCENATKGRTKKQRRVEEAAGARNGREISFTLGPTPFYSLPLEIRLEIYGYFSPLSLLILTHTCRTMYVDINCARRLFIRPKGYRTNPQPGSNTEEQPPSHPMLPAGVTPLTIRMLDHHIKLALGSEIELFNSVFGRPKYSWRCCSVCRVIKRRWHFGIGSCAKCINRRITQRDLTRNIDMWTDYDDRRRARQAARAARAAAAQQGHALPTSVLGLGSG